MADCLLQNIGGELAESTTLRMIPNVSEREANLLEELAVIEWNQDPIGCGTGRQTSAQVNHNSQPLDPGRRSYCLKDV
jgi:hypothetical protein